MMPLQKRFTKTCEQCGRAFQAQLHKMGRVRFCGRVCFHANRSSGWRDKFHTRINKSGDCWEWTAGVTPDGYGKMRIEGVDRLAHRIAWEEFVGPIPDELWVLHRCDNPPCCNPDHLWLGTHLDNMQDMARKGRSGIYRGEQLWSAKLTEECVRSIRRMHASGVSKGTLCGHFGVGRSAISLIVRNKRWVHVKC